jgi:hypothetical protein
MAPRRPTLFGQDIGTGSEAADEEISEFVGGVNKGAFDLALMPASAYDWATRKAGLNRPSQREYLQGLLERRGLYPTEEPSDLGGSVVRTAGEFLGGSVIPMGAALKFAQKIPANAGPLIRTLLEPVAKAPLAATAVETAGALGGGALAGVSRHYYPGNAYLELISGLVGGIGAGAPLAARTTAKGAARVPPGAEPEPEVAWLRGEREPGTPDAQKTVLEPEPAPAGANVAMPGQTVTDYQAARIADAMGGDAELQKWAGNLNLERRNSPVEIKRGFQELMDQMGGDQAFWARRRDYRGEAGGGRSAGDRTARVTQDEVLQRSEKYVGEMLGKSPDEITRMRLSGEWLPEKLAAADTALHVADYEVALARKAMLEGTEGSREQWLGALTRQSAIAYELAGSSSEVGRALNILKKQTTLRKKALARGRLLKRFGGADDVDELAKRLDELDDAAQRAGVGRAMVLNADRGWGWKVADIWKAGLLSGPMTHMVNIKSNALFTAWFHGFEQPASALVGLAKAPVRAAMGKERDRVFLQEAGAEIYGLIKAVGLAGRTAMRSTMDDVEWSPSLHAKEYKRDVLGQTVGTSTSQSAFDVTPTKFKSKIGRVFPGGPFALLRGEDAYFKHLAYSARLHGLGMREAIEKGIPIKDRFRYVANYVRNPKPKVMKEAMDRAAELTYTNELGHVGKAIQRLANSHPMMAGLLTFVKTPANVMKQGARRTPLVGQMSPQNWRDIRAGGQAADRAVARMATGGALGLYYANEISEGRITGPMPDDAAERDLFMSEGKMPYSWLVERDGKEFWESYGRLEPLATPLAFMATMMNWNRQGKLSADEMEQIPGLVGMALSENFMAKSMLQGPHKGFRAAGEPTKFGQQYLEGLAGSVVPAGMTQLARASDMYRRDQTGLWDSAAQELHAKVPPIAARIMDWREDLPQRFDLVGRPFISGDVRDPTWKRLVTEYVSESRRHPILDAIAVSNARIQLASDTITVPKGMLYSGDQLPSDRNEAQQRDDDLAVDAYLLEGSLRFEMRPEDQEFLNQAGNSAAAAELQLYIPNLMKVRNQIRPIDVKDLRRHGVPKEIMTRLRERGMGRAFVTDIIRDLIQDAYVRHRDMAKMELLDKWRQDGTLRQELDKALDRQQSRQRGRER